MKVFISFSGVPSVSCDFAKALHDWVPSVLQSVDPWVSEIDIFKGHNWPADLSKALEDSSFGIFCLTPENLHSPWISYEAGVLSKTFRVCPLLINLSQEEIRDHPLAQFQCCNLEAEDILNLLLSINDSAGAQSMDPSKLKKAFEMSWKVFEQKAIDILRRFPTKAHGVAPTTRTFKLLPAEGILINPADESRNIAFKVDTINTIFERVGSDLRALTDLERARSTFFVAGQKAGGEFAERIKTQWSLQFPEDSIQDRIERWCHFDSDVGWGRLMSSLVVDDDKGEISGTVSLMNNFQTYNRNIGMFPDCALMFGYIKGVLESLCAGIPISVDCRRGHCPLANPCKRECIFDISLQKPQETQ